MKLTLKINIDHNERKSLNYFLYRGGIDDLCALMQLYFASFEPVPTRHKCLNL